MEKDMYGALLRELECPVCTDYMAPPIRQCATGHSICQRCRQKLPKCPLCQDQFTDAKNIALEALAAKMRFPCVNEERGCREKLTPDKREEHEKSCPHRGVRCAMEKCGWVGKYEELARHWDSKKTSSKPYGPMNVCHTRLKMGSMYVNMVKAYDELFWFKCKTEGGKIFWAVQYVGNSPEASKYYYEIKLFKPGMAERKVVFTDQCHGVDVENKALFQEENCMSMTTDAVKHYMGEDEVLIYYFNVHEVGQKCLMDQLDLLNLEGKANKNRRDHSQGPFKKHNVNAGQHFKKNPGFKKKASNTPPNAGTAKETADFILL